MAQLIIDIPDAIASRVLTDISNAWGWTAEIPDPAATNYPPPMIPNPRTRMAYVKAKFAALLKEQVVAYEAARAETQARLDAQAKAEAEITLS